MMFARPAISVPAKVHPFKILYSFLTKTQGSKSLRAVKTETYELEPADI